ncbi:hypothetical protein FQN57_001638 [Myotisia sp. PD_48]|nr:hypothetical protein FQN57_001638 [Myotisia sp. PD_48]
MEKKDRIANLLQKFEVAHEGGTIPSPWINNDIKPIESARRTWTVWAYTTFWVLINSNISTYMTGSSMIALGLLWWQAIIAILVGVALATLFVVLNSLPGAYYHIGFPVVNRYVWGLYGSQFVIWNRILLSVVWYEFRYGFQAFIGGQCVYVCLQSIWPSLEQRIPNHLSPSTGVTTASFVSYIIFMVISLPFVYIRPHKLRVFFYISASIVLVFEAVLCIWALATMGPSGFGDTIDGPSIPVTDVGWKIAFGVISTIGAISAGILNQNDYARFTKRPRDAIMGQLVSFPISYIVCSVIGVLVTAATQNRFGAPLWSLPSLFSAIIEHGGSRSRAAAFFAGMALVVSQIGVNVAGNALSGGFDLAATFPKYINIRRGAYITVLVSVAALPWKLVSTATIFLTVLSGYAVFLGPMTGLMISSWFVVNKRKLKIEDLYVGDSSSIYWFNLGVDWRALIAWLCGIALSFPGFISRINEKIVVPMALTRIYQLCFLVGFGTSALVYCGLHVAFPDRRLQDFVSDAPAAEILTEKYRDNWDEIPEPAEQRFPAKEEKSDTDQVSFVVGSLPLTFSLSSSQLRLTSALGMGLLVGTSLIVIIPEGVETLYSSAVPISHHPHRRGILEKPIDIRWKHNSVEPLVLSRVHPTWNSLSRRVDVDSRLEAEAQDAREVDRNHKEGGKSNVLFDDKKKESEPKESDRGDSSPHAWVGIGLIAGFVVMYLIDKLPQFVSFSNKQNQRPYHISLDNLGLGLGRGLSPSRPTSSPRPGSGGEGLATTIGLVIHAAADGVALGASSSSANLSFIIFLAIMVHKAPASFGLTSTLLKQGVSHRAARAYLLMFSLAAPVGALLTWFVAHTVMAGHAGNEQNAKWRTGVLLLFSAGTFLYVAMQTMQEKSPEPTRREYQTNGYADGRDVTSQKPKLTVRELMASLVGMLVPLFLQIGHAH